MGKNLSHWEKKILEQELDLAKLRREVDLAKLWHEVTGLSAELAKDSLQKISPGKKNKDHATLIKTAREKATQAEIWETAIKKVVKKTVEESLCSVQAAVGWVGVAAR